MRRLALLLALLAPPATAQDADLVGTARAILAQLQPNSIRAGREICGLIVRSPDGHYRAIPPRMGSTDGCTPRDDPRVRGEVVASFHTHGGFDEGMDSEVPSLADLRADRAEGIVGFVSTPGGRLWLVDGPRDRVRMLCDVGCLPRDPLFRRGAAGPIARGYDARGLKRRERELMGGS
ncbi:DUF4329 domain-containing protein [Jannaschia sp. Os4]|uniref:DUF4329 domain-containing protein n=1 Tax=Jannaschia sp. Os4 TaxID=2807617 RepID=UPI001939B8EF|nr:DUF4329 domain-containing protein [Jannaschia sp. Os4]MBM2577666.1 DUF4329 domain-containing protein [Jannaschia sp. Os4]